jgi:hypothetical protein
MLARAVRGTLDWNKVKKEWTVTSRKDFWSLAHHLAEVNGRCLALVDYNVKQRCHAQCQRALGSECACSCAYQFHGAEHGGSPVLHWIDVGNDVLIANELGRRRYEIVRGTPKNPIFAY